MPEKPAAKTVNVADVFASLRSAFAGIGLAGVLISILMATGPLFRLQVYDRVLVSGSVPTLIVIDGLAFGKYDFHGLLEGIRCGLFELNSAAAAAWRRNRKVQASHQRP